MSMQKWRCRILIAESDFEVKYIPEHQNAVNDSLFRIFSISEVDTQDEACLE